MLEGSREATVDSNHGGPTLMVSGACICRVPLQCWPCSALSQQHLSLRTVRSCPPSDAAVPLPRLLSACVRYGGAIPNTLDAVNGFIRGKFQAHISTLQKRLKYMGYSLMLSYLPLDSHPRKLTELLAELIRVLLGGEYGALTLTDVDVQLYSWKRALCVQVRNHRVAGPAS